MDRLKRINLLIDGPLTNTSLDRDFAQFNENYSLSCLATELITIVKSEPHLIPQIPDTLKRVSYFDGKVGPKGNLKNFTDFGQMMTDRVNIQSPKDLVGETRLEIDRFFNFALAKNHPERLIRPYLDRLRLSYADLLIHQDLKLFFSLSQELINHEGYLKLITQDLRKPNSSPALSKFYELYQTLQYFNLRLNYNQDISKWRDLIKVNDRLRSIFERSLKEPAGSIYYSHLVGKPLSDRENLSLLKHLLKPYRIGDDTDHSDTVYGPRYRQFRAKNFLFEMDYTPGWHKINSSEVKQKGSPERIAAYSKDRKIQASLKGITKITRSPLTEPSYLRFSHFDDYFDLNVISGEIKKDS